MGQWKTLVPDAHYIRRELLVSDVALKLGLDVRGRWVRCPRDRSHQARIWLKKNRIKCFKCPHACWSTIDLAQEVLELDFPQAIRWFDANFDIPKRRVCVTTNLHGLTKHKFVHYPVLKRAPRLQPSIDTLRRAPLWTTLTPTARRLALFLIDGIPRETLTLTVSYRELQGSLQVGDRGTLARAFNQLRRIGLIETAREATGEEGFAYYAARTLVRLTWSSPQFQHVLSARRSAGKLSSLRAAFTHADGARSGLARTQNQERERATKSIGRKLDHETGKKLDHEEVSKIGKKLNHGEGLELPVFERVRGDPVLQKFLVTFDCEILSMYDLTVSTQSGFQFPGIETRAEG